MKVRARRQQRTKQPPEAENEIFSADQARDAEVQLQVREQEGESEWEPVTDDLDNLLASLFAQTAQHPLPFRPELEHLLSRPLPPDVQVIYDAERLAGLDDLTAQALVRDNVIVFENAQPDFDTVAHEVIHLLQVNAQLPAANDLLATQEPAEKEARQLTEHLKHRHAQSDWDNFLPLPVERGISPQTFAAQRGDIAPPPVSEAEVADRELEQSLAGPDQQAESGSDRPEPETAETVDTLDDLEPAGELEEEALEPPELPEAPEPGVTEADVEARREALAEAEAALENAEDANGVVDSYAAAPPTLKAREAGNVDQKVNEKSASEEQTYQENLPDFHAEMKLQSEEVEAAEVSVPEQEAAETEADAPGAIPEVELPPAPDHGQYAANDDIVATVRSWLNSWFGDDRATRIGDNLRDVSTTDPEVSADPGEAPRVPLEGEADPERITDQRDQTADRSRQKRDEAQQAVIDGPGPEQVQPRNMDEVVEIGELDQPDMQATIEAQGPDTYLQYELPEEVDTAFDQDNQQSMEESFVEAKTKVQEATDTRDRDRQTAVDHAESETQRLSEEADADQRDQVMATRTTIQNERQSTLDSQRDAVNDLETDIENRRTQDQQDIDNRITEDEQQIQNDYDQAERDAQSEIDSGERDAEAEKRKSEREAEDQSWWDRAVNFVKRAFEALTAAINAIFDAVRSAVNAILDAVKEAATRLIRAAANFVKGAITAFGEFAKGVVNVLLADTFPGLARALNERIDGAVTAANQAVDAAADTLIAGVNALVEGLRGALNAVLDAFQAALNTVLQIMQAALTGDWAAVIRLAFEAVLKVAGIDPEEVYAFIGRAMETLNIILDDPLGFVGNLFDAFTGGVRQFADNILTHLQAGIIGWLTGALGPAGITLPEQFNLMGVLDIVRQVLGFTWDNIRSRVVRIIGERGVQVLEFLYGYIETLVTGGWGALWEQIISDLEGLRDMVFDQIKEFVLTRLVMAAVTRLATMFNPVGAIVNLLIMAYQFYTFLRDNIQRLVQLIQSFFEAVDNIARGVLGPAMDRVEGTLAQFLPMAIDLVARLIGLGNVGGRVRRIISRVQQRIWGAIDRLIERVMSRFRGGSGATEETAAAAEAAAGGEQLGERLPIPAPDGTHHLSLEVAGSNVTFVVSSERQTVDERVAMWRRQLREQPETVPEGRRSDVNSWLNSLSSAEDASKRTLEDLLRQDATISAQDQNAAEAEQRELLPILVNLFRIFGLGEGEANIGELYIEELNQADRFAREDILGALNQHASEVVQNGTKIADWQSKVATEEFYLKPLLIRYGLGEQTRTIAIAWMPSYFDELRQDENFDRPVTEPANDINFHTSRVRMVHDNHEVFRGALDQVQQQVFNGGSQYTYDTHSDFYTKYKHSIRRYLEGTPSPHGEYEPIMLSQFTFSGSTTQVYTYNRVRIQKQDGTIEEVDPPVFSVTLRNGRVTEILAAELRFKRILADVRSGQRGRMQSPPDYDSGLLLNRSHLVADEFMGSAFNDANNVVVTSETYNQRDMRAVERRIAADIIDLANDRARMVDPNVPEALPEDVTFDLAITVTYAQSVFDDHVRDEMVSRLGTLMDQHEAIIADREALARQWLRLNIQLESKLNNVQPVRSMRYRITVSYQGTPFASFSDRLGPDIYLGLELSAVRALFRAAGAG